MLRRMSKAVKIGVGAALPILQDGPAPSGIIIGTGNGGMEDAIKFLNQIIQYDEGMLTPGHFVQSTANALPSTISMLTGNKSYNITHVHRGLAFENALLDAQMLVKENPEKTFLLGTVDEISTHNYHIEYLDGLYKKEALLNKDLYDSNSPGTIAGEAAVMFQVSSDPSSALARCGPVELIHSTEPSYLTSQFQRFLEKLVTADHGVDLFISGENGDKRHHPFHESCESVLDADLSIVRFKHMSGEFPTATAMACWLACQILQNQVIPSHMIKRKGREKKYKNILIYNYYKGIQHSFMLLSAP
jgi:Beta-ketoacyl synthase, N-terminal domain